MYHSGNNLIDPNQLFEKVGLLPAMRVAVFGCGRTGHIVFPAAHVVGKDGVVYAVDIMKEILAEIQKRAALTPMHQVHTVWSDVEQVGKTAIPKESLDVVFLVNILTLVKEKESVLAEALRLLNNTGRLLIADWIPCTLPLCPPRDRIMDLDTMKRWALANTLTIEEEFEAGKYHVGIVLKKARANQ